MIDYLFRFADAATARADSVVQANMDATHSSWRPDYVLPGVSARRISTGSASSGFYVQVSRQDLIQEFLDHSALQYALYRDGPPYVVKNNIGAVLGDTLTSPVFAGFVDYRKYQIPCLGDSHTFAALGIGFENYYAADLQDIWTAAGLKVGMANFGSSGFTTGQVLQRANSSLVRSADSPSIAIIYAGTNDLGTAHLGSVQSSPSPTTTTFTVQAGLGAEFTPGTRIKVGGISRIVSTQSADDITISAPLIVPPVAGAVVENDTTANLIATGNALVAKGYARLMVGLMHYFNWSASGDTLSTPVAGNVTLRAAQRAAATALGATVVDFYAYMRNRIVAGTDVQGSFSWHIADKDSHLNAYGESILAACIDASLPPDWRAALRR